MTPEEQRILDRRVAEDRNNARIAQQKRADDIAWRERESHRLAQTEKRRQEDFARLAQQREEKLRKPEKSRADPFRLPDGGFHWQPTRRGTGGIDESTHSHRTVRRGSGGSTGKIILIGVAGFIAWMYFANRQDNAAPSQDRPEIQTFHPEENTPIRSIGSENTSRPSPSTILGNIQPQDQLTTRTGAVVQPALNVPTAVVPRPTPVIPELLSAPKPIYPALARNSRLSGRVLLAIDIAPDGRVLRSRVEKGNPILARAAMDAVQHWRYRPIDTDQHYLTTTVNFEFNLPQ